MWRKSDKMFVRIEDVSLMQNKTNSIGDPYAFASKAPAASLNLSTYPSLKACRYKNIYELGPRANLQTTAIPFSRNSVKPSPADKK